MQSGICHECADTAFHFHYTKPFDGNGHEGYWHCALHGPVRQDTSGSRPANDTRGPYSHLNREQRRKLKRDLK